MKSNREGCHPPQLSDRSTTSTVDRLSNARGDTTYRRSTSRDLDDIWRKRNAVSSPVWAQLHRDRERLEDMGHSHLHLAPWELRNGNSQTSGPPACAEVSVNRWVALPRRLPPIRKNVQLAFPAHTRRSCGGAPLSGRVGRTSGFSTTDSDLLEYHTAREDSSGIGFPGITSVPFKCPALSTARKTPSCVSSSLDSQIALRKAMRSRIERQRKFVLSKHVEFVSCNKVNGKRLRNPRDHTDRTMVGCFSSSHNVNIEMMAILSVQEFNKPLMPKEVLPDAPIK